MLTTVLNPQYTFREVFSPTLEAQVTTVQSLPGILNQVRELTRRAKRGKETSTQQLPENEISASSSFVLRFTPK